MRKRYTADRSVLQNAAKTLLANIRFASVDDPIRSIVVTSSVPNEGKTTVSTSLGEAIASSGKRCLMVECDMRKRSLAHALGVRSTSGVYAVLTDQVPLAEAVVETHVPNLYFLDAEPSIPNPADIISSKRFGRLVGTFEESYDYVVLDSPPVGTFVDAAILSSMADATLFVLRENFAKRAEIENAFDQLRKADANVIGTVLNYCQDDARSSSYYYYDYYNKDGRKNRPHSHAAGGAETAPRGVAQAVPPTPAGGKRFK